MSSPTTPIYMDYAATTPVDPRVVAQMTRYLGPEGTFANPASRSHMLGWLAEQAVENARRQVADLIHADPREIVWTSGATEADNLALIGFMRANRARGRHLITSSIEHKAILDTATSLEKEGFEVTLLPPDHNGCISAQQLSAALRPDTVLVSLMAVNNEVGSRNDIAALGAVARAHGAAFHVDAAQGAGKIDLDVERQPIDMLSLSAHKVYGPKGIGALYVRRGIQIDALIHGGGHERGMRSGTLPTHQIVGMGTAFALARDERIQDNQHIAALSQQLRAQLAQLPGVHFSIDDEHSVANILSVGFDNVDGQALLMEMRSLATATGSACNSASVAPSYVLKALDIPDQRALATLRLSLGRFSTAQDVDGAADIITSTLPRLRSVTPSA